MEPRVSHFLHDIIKACNHNIYQKYLEISMLSCKSQDTIAQLAF